MLAVYVSVPIACFRKGIAREYLETEMVPPPSTCYGFFLSLIGEEDRWRHIGCRIVPATLNDPNRSAVMRTVWRVTKIPSWFTGKLSARLSAVADGSRIANLA